MSRAGADCVKQLPFDAERVVCEVGKDGWNAELVVRADLWNWGDPTSTTLGAVAGAFKFQRWNLVVIESLLTDLHLAFYGQRFQVVEYGSALFTHLCDHANGFLDFILLHFDSHSLFQTGRPIAHIVADIMACIAFLREEAGNKYASSSCTEQVRKIEKRRKDFWYSRLGNIHSTIPLIESQPGKSRHRRAERS